MAKYQESTVSGESWIRSFRVEIDNPLVDATNSTPLPGPQNVPTIFFAEEQVVQTVDGTYIKQRVNDTNYNVFAIDQLTPETLNETFIVLDSDGNETSTTMTYSDLYNLLSSLYIHVAKKRDERISNLEQQTNTNGV